MSAPLNHIFDPSACFTRRQLRDYLKGSMSPEEQHAAEHHLNSCLLCSTAMDGMLAHGDVTAVMDTVNHSFLKEHFIQTSPQVHLNSLAMAAPVVAKRSRVKGRGVALVKPSTVAAALLLSIGALWYMEYGKNIQHKPAAQPTVKAPAETAIVPANGEELFATTKPEASLTVVMPDEPVASDVDPTKGDGGQPAKEMAAPVVVEVKEPIKKDQPKPAPKTGELPKTGEKPAMMPQEQPVNSPRLMTESKEEKKNEEIKADSGKNKSEETEDSADDLFESGKYGAALQSYKKKMKSGDDRSRQDAALMAARCYMNLGKKGNAVELLETLASNGSGSPKRAAKRMLRQMSNETVGN